MGPPGSEVRERAAAYHAKNRGNPNNAIPTGRMTNAAKFQLKETHLSYSGSNKKPNLEGSPDLITKPLKHKSAYNVNSLKSAD
jgi:hypothetical protein